MSDWAARLEARRRGRRILVLLAALAAVVLLLCMGFAPTLLRGMFSRPGSDNLANQLTCGSWELASTPAMNGLSTEQVTNAGQIIATGRQLKIPPRGWVVAIATALQESTLRNLRVAVDHDSLGLFQQRPSMGWGTPGQVLDPKYSSTKFYEKLLQVKGWQSMRVTEAAQRVQRSAFPGAYQKWESLAAALVAKLGGAALKATSIAPHCAAPGQVSLSGWMIPLKSFVGSGFRTGDRPGHDGVDLIVARHTPIHAASAGIVTEVRCQASIGTCNRDGGPSVRGCGWYVEVTLTAGVFTRYCHMAQRPSVVVGQRVEPGTVLGFVGSSGNSSGPHLHFEVHIGSDAVDPVRFMATRGAPLGQRA